MKNIGELIRYKRKYLNLSQAELAHRVGITQPAVFKIEKGDTKEPKKIVFILKVLGIPISTLDEYAITLEPSEYSKIKEPIAFDAKDKTEEYVTPPIEQPLESANFDTEQIKLWIQWKMSTKFLRMLLGLCSEEISSVVYTLTLIKDHKDTSMIDLCINQLKLIRNEVHIEKNSDKNDTHQST